MIDCKLTKNEAVPDKKRDVFIEYALYNEFNKNKKAHFTKEDMIMMLFSKKRRIMLYTEQQRDEFIEKLEKANVEFDIREDKDDVPSHKTAFIISIREKDYKKVV